MAYRSRIDLKAYRTFFNIQSWFKTHKSNQFEIGIKLRVKKTALKIVKCNFLLIFIFSVSAFLRFHFIFLPESRNLTKNILCLILI